ncbi:MAG: AraC family transcriptional regulator [Synergistaceae bacterium]|nr:AraC family transcriptional regulator [Synergistaceae bacterium]
MSVVRGGTKAMLEMGNSIEWSESQCFRRFDAGGGFSHFEAKEGASDGFVRQIVFDAGFCVECFNCRFKRPARKYYSADIPFIEMLYLDSVGAAGRKFDGGGFSVRKGMYVFMHEDDAGELVFTPGTAIKGTRVVVREKFYRGCLGRKFPEEILDFRKLSPSENPDHSNPQLRLALGQLERSVGRGVSSALYYESKIAELLFLAVSEGLSEPSGHDGDARRLNEADLQAVSLAKRIIDERISVPPKIAELASMTGTGATKLQIDFKLAFGHTIHDHVQKTRMKEALRKVENSDESLYSIAKSVGCKNSGHFSRIFKSAFGVAPSEYRRFRK